LTDRRKKNCLCCWIGCSESLRPRLVNIGKVRLFSAYRESKHDFSVVQPIPLLLYQLSYCSNTYRFVSWLSWMFISCWFVVKMTAKNLFPSIEILGFYLQPVFIQKVTPF
jgi:hypothetical protein